MKLERLIMAKPSTVYSRLMKSKNNGRQGDGCNEEKQYQDSERLIQAQQS